jgi:hypothetical protein
MDAHGSLETFLKAGCLQFTWTYRMKDKGPQAVISTRQIINPLNLDAVHEVTGSSIKMGWTENKAWISPPDGSFPVPPRFWALTPYYFVGIPFVFADLGTQTTKLPDFTFEDNSYQQIKITYGKDSGDAPDDYYILLINPKTNRVAAVRYIVTSSLVAKHGPLPEKLLTLEKYENVNGVLFPTYHRTFKMNDGQVGEEIRDASTSELKFLNANEVDFSIPKDAKTF